MKIRYEFATGEVSEIEVSEELGRAIEEMTHKAALRDRAETRRHTSLDKLLSLGAQIGDEQASTEELAERALDQAALSRAMDMLGPQQRCLIQRVYFDGCAIASIALEEGVWPNAIQSRLRRAETKLRKFIEGGC